MKDLQSQAIAASLCADWETAIELNTQILAENPRNMNALNRLARAYTELGQKESAKMVYEQVLQIDKYNSIAIKNLKLLPSKNGTSGLSLSPEDFIEESGLTKSVALIKPASKEILLTLNCKQIIVFTKKGKLISVNKEDGTYIGCLPDDMSLKISRCIQSGYKYSACIKSTSDSLTTIFIREIKRPNRPYAIPSFSRLTPLRDKRPKSK